MLKSLLLAILIMFSGCQPTEPETNEYGDRLYYETLEDQYVEVKKGITYFEGYLDPLYSCFIEILGDDFGTYVSLENEDYYFYSENFTSYAYIIEDYGYYTLEVEADADDYIYINIDCY